MIPQELMAFMQGQNPYKYCPKSVPVPFIPLSNILDSVRLKQLYIKHGAGRWILIMRHVSFGKVFSALVWYLISSQGNSYVLESSVNRFANVIIYK